MSVLISKTTIAIDSLIIDGNLIISNDIVDDEITLFANRIYIRDGNFKADFSENGYSSSSKKFKIVLSSPNKN